MKVQFLFLILLNFTFSLYSSADGLESIYQKDNLESVHLWKGDRSYALSSGVVALYSLRFGKVLCSGFLVTPNHIMTTNTCAVDCDDMQVMFYYELNSPGQWVSACVATEALSESLNYRIHRLQFDSDGIAPFTLAKELPDTGMPLTAIAHSGGDIKRGDRSESCRVSDSRFFGDRDHLVRHQCDTERGSQGGPLIGKDDSLVYGLQWLGGANTFDPKSANRGLLMSPIIQDLAKNFPEIHSLLSVQ
jgi:hypothetical protein